MKHFSPHHIATDDINGLGAEELRAYVPSLYAAQPHESRSSDYNYVPTIEILRSLGRQGFRIMSAMQSSTRDASRREFTKHMVRMRHTRGNTETADLRFEVVIVNSHDGTSSYIIAAGANVFACSNGIITGDGLNFIRVRHNSPGLADDVIEGSLALVGNAHTNIGRITRLREVMLTPAEVLHFAEKALTIKNHRSNDNVQSSTIRPADLTVPRRSSDASRDLYHVFNVVQENVIRGGIRTTSPHGRRSVTRPVMNIDADMRINTGLWELAKETYEEKTGKALV